MQSRNKKIAVCGLLSASAVILYVIESFIPHPLPWLRFGLGNIMVLIALYLLGLRGALLVSLLKSILGALIIGTLFTPSFIFSLSGSLVSVLVMGIFHVFLPGVFSPLGISLWGSLAHNNTQLLIASLLFIGKNEVLYLLPFFNILALIAGTITGIIALVVIVRLQKIHIAF
jgi:heptaprenyl diphosphate synthase